MAALLSSLPLGGPSGNTITTTTSNQEKTDAILNKIASSSRASSPSYFDKVAKDIVAASPVFGKARLPVIAGHRDKESLMVEIIDLKRALEDTVIHLKMHKQHYTRCLEESRKLEREVEELELKGNYDAPRTGGVVRLENKFKERHAQTLWPSYAVTHTKFIPFHKHIETRVLNGEQQNAVSKQHIRLGAQLDLLEDLVADRKHGELAQLKKDLGATHTKETEVERDTLASEISRLKIYLNHMKLLNDEAKEENENLNFCKRHWKRLSEWNPKLAQAVETVKASIKNGREEIEKIHSECEEKVTRMELLSQIGDNIDKRLEQLKMEANEARVEKHKVEKLNSKVGYEMMIFNQDFRKEHPVSY